MSFPALSPVSLQAVTVVPHLTTDTHGKLRMVVCSATVVGVCLNPLDAEALDQETFARLLRSGTWATVLRAQENAYYVPSTGLMPKDNDTPSDNPDPEVVQMALEIGLATWPEWGNVFRDHLTPRFVVPFGFPSNRIEA